MKKQALQSSNKKYQGSVCYPIVILIQTQDWKYEKKRGVIYQRPGCTAV